MAKKRIGDLLLELGFTNDNQVSIAMKVQKANKDKKIGEILQDLNFITSTELAQAIAKYSELDFIDIDDVTPDIDVLQLVNEDVAVSKNILPLYEKDGMVYIALDDVGDIMLIDFLKQSISKPLEFVVGDAKKISRSVLVNYYQLKNPIETQIAQTIKSIVDDEEIDIAQLVEFIFNNAIKDFATDIHISPDSLAINISYRVNGVLMHYYSIPVSVLSKLVARIKILSSLDIAEQRKPQDGALSYEFLNESFDFRVSILPTNYGENIVIRLLGKNISLFNLSNLGLLDSQTKKLKELFAKPNGIVLVTGPTGSGKTTTLYSALRTINSLERNIMTIEDPIEYKFSFIKQTQINNKAGYTFAAAIRTFMRQDPDVILVGEIRDGETAELAIGASITGHLVLSTLHANSAVSAIPRLADLGIKEYLIATGLLAVLAQRLVRTLCKHCKKEWVVTREELRSKGLREEFLDQEEFTIYEAGHCSHCNHTGYAGRASVIEILEVDYEIADMISSKKNAGEILEKAKSKGMLTMRDSALLKVLHGETSLQEVDRVVS
jgi:type IV pilus assembly protein PilB